jgi:hypothetical protein
MSERAVFRDPRELLFGLNDLAERLRSLRQEDLHACWPEIQKHIEDLIETLDSFDQSFKAQRPLTGSTYQSVVLALDALRTARRSASEYSLAVTAEAVRRASLIMRGGSVVMPVGR